MRIFKRHDDKVHGWYYGDSRDRRVSPTYEHEGVLDKWAEVMGAYEAFNVVIQSPDIEGEKIIGPYGDYETADRRRCFELRGRSAEYWVTVRKDMVMNIEELA